MKKLVAIVALGVIAMSCSDKKDNSLQDSNVMLEEPAAEVVTTEATATTTPATDATVAAPVDSTATK